MAKQYDEVESYKNVSFFWRTDLTPERMRQIDNWIESLTLDQKQMIRELRQDAVEEERFESRSESSDRF